MSAETILRKPINVAQVRKLSPFRYPGGKTWLIPVARQWLASGNAAELIEPFDVLQFRGIFQVSAALFLNLVVIPQKLNPQAIVHHKKEKTQRTIASAFIKWQPRVSVFQYQREHAVG